MSLRDDLMSVAHDGHILADELGLRFRQVIVRTTTRAVTGLASIGDPGCVSDLVLDPPPRVRGTTRLLGAPAGLVQQGDLMLRVSPIFTREQLDPPGDSVWIIDGEPYALVSLDERFLGWDAIVRPRRPRSPTT